METVNTGLIAALGGLGVVVIMAFRQLIDTVVTLNGELRSAITERETLYEKINTLEAHIIRLEAELSAQTTEIKALRAELAARSAIFETPFES